MRRLKLIFFAACAVSSCTIPAWAQHTVKGVVKDSREHSVTGALSGNQIQDRFPLLAKEEPQTMKVEFAIEGLKSGDYGLEISFLGYSNHYQDLKLDRTTDLGIIHLQESSMNLEEVVVTASMVKKICRQDKNID